MTDERLTAEEYLADWKIIDDALLGEIISHPVPVEDLRDLIQKVQAEARKAMLEEVSKHVKRELRKRLGKDELPKIIPWVENFINSIRQFADSFAPEKKG